MMDHFFVSKPSELSRLFEGFNFLRLFHSPQFLDGIGKRNPLDLRELFFQGQVGVVSESRTIKADFFLSDFLLFIPEHHLAGSLFSGPLIVSSIDKKDSLFGRNKKSSFGERKPCQIK